MDPGFASVSHRGDEFNHERKRQTRIKRAGNHGGNKTEGVECTWFREMV